MIAKLRIVQNRNIPSCYNCIYYKMSNTRCEKFSNENTVNKIYHYANYCRSDETKCGKKGNNFKEEKNINIKILTRGVIYIIPCFIPLLFILSNIKI